MRKQINDLNSRIGGVKQTEEKVKYNFLEKDQEIRFLKNFVANLKSDNKGTAINFYYYIVKDMKYSTLKTKLKKMEDDNKSLRNSINTMEYKYQVYNIIASDDDGGEEMENGKTNKYKSVNFSSDIRTSKDI